MPSARKTALALTTLALTSLGLSVGPAVHAQATLNSSYNNPNSDGYVTTFGQSYTVVAPATFDNNGENGLRTVDSNINVNGGDFSGNAGDGLRCQWFIVQCYH